MQWSSRKCCNNLEHLRSVIFPVAVDILALFGESRFGILQIRVRTLEQYEIESVLYGLYGELLKDIYVAKLGYLFNEVPILESEAFPDLLRTNSLSRQSEIKMITFRIFQILMHNFCNDNKQQKFSPKLVASIDTYLP